MLEIRHLRSLVAIADAGQLTLAAKQIHLTPSALSHQIRVLENHFNVKLIIRSRERINFTKAGERLLTFARSMIVQLAELEQDMSNNNDE